MNSQFTPIPGTFVAINWATIPAHYKFVTVSQCLEIAAHITKPTAKSNGYWQSDGNRILQGGNDFTHLENWQTLIFERPEQ